MRKLFTLVASLMFFGAAIAQDSVTVFDPATFTGTLEANMSIVTKGGKKYLQCIGSPTLPFAKLKLQNQGFKVGVNTDLRGEIIVSGIDTGTAVGNTRRLCLELNDTINKVPAPWDANTMIEAGINLTSDFSKDDLTGTYDFTKKFLEEMDSVHTLNAYVMETNTWLPISYGDTIWVGTIYAKQVVVVIATPTNTGEIFKVANGDITVDGENFDEYAGEAFIINRITYDDVNGGASDTVAGSTFAEGSNGTGKFWAAWDEENLYLYAEIKDATPVPGTSGWKDDGVDIFVDVTNTRIVGGGRKGDQFTLNLGTDGEVTTPLKGCTKATMTITGGYSIEVAFAWDSLKGIDKVTLAGDLKIAFDFASMSWTGDPAKRTISAWGNNTGKDVTYQQTDVWGEMRLMGWSTDVPTVVAADADVVSVEIIDVLGRTIDVVKSIDDVNIEGIAILRITLEDGSVIVKKVGEVK